VPVRELVGQRGGAPDPHASGDARNPGLACPCNLQASTPETHLGFSWEHGDSTSKVAPHAEPTSNWAGPVAPSGAKWASRWVLVVRGSEPVRGGAPLC
jgi:hypothetical protein